MGAIGKSTSVQTKDNKISVDGTAPASFRYQNPGAQWPSEEAARFGQLGYGVIGGGNKIALFPSPVNGAASNFELLSRKYVGMAIGPAGTKWTGSNGFGVPGYNPNQLLTEDMLQDPKQAIAFLKAIANRESGHGSNLTEFQWQQAHTMFLLGSADAFLNQNTPEPLQDPNTAVSRWSGAGLIQRARAHIGQAYENVLVPKDDSNWAGPWDCAEFMSWLVYQESGMLYGCIDDNDNPSHADAYTGAWKADALKKGILISPQEALNTVGAILLRYPPGPGKMGHIVLSDGRGGTIEAKGHRYGVVADTAQSRYWDTGILLPGFNYDKTAEELLPIAAPTTLYRRGAPNMSAETVVRIQRALLADGFDPGLIDGDFGPNTEAAVLAFQNAQGLTVDGIVGPETAEALGVAMVPDRATGSDGQVVYRTPIPTAPEVKNDLASTTSLGSSTIIEQLLGKIAMSTPTTSSDKNEHVKTVILNALQALQSNEKIDVKQMAQSILQSLPSQLGAQAPGSAPPNPQTGNPMADQLLKSILIALAQTDGAPKLGPVNGALGQTIGNLLNGKKTAIGVIGAVLSGILSSAPAGSTLANIVNYLPIFSGTGGMFLSLFLGIVIWGALGKQEKWNTGSS